jgi:hypothetical protein
MLTLQAEEEEAGENEPLKMRDEHEQRDANRRARATFHRKRLAAVAHERGDARGQRQRQRFEHDDGFCLRDIAVGAWCYTRKSGV